MRIWIFLTMMITTTMANALDFTFDSIDGGTLSLKDFKGSPILVINTASRCGFTSQLRGMQKLHETYQDQGLVVLAVPSNDFNQELSSELEVKEFCDLNYSTTMPMTSITRIKGAQAHPFFQWAREKTGYVPRWNFNKILINGNGDIVASFGSSARPRGRKITSAIEALLNEKL